MNFLEDMEISMDMNYVLAKKLFGKGVALEAKHNTIFTAIREYGSMSELVSKAISGVATAVRMDINLFRNTILPVAKDLEIEVKNKSSLTPKSFADEVFLHTNHYQDGLDIMARINMVDVNVIADYSKLPTNPLVIEYDENIVRENMTFANEDLNQHYKEILIEYEDDYLKELHESVFGNVSSNNMVIRDIGLNPVMNYNDAMLLLLLTEGYISGTVGVSNIPVKDVRTKYLYTLRNALVTILAKYRTMYQRYLQSETLISGVSKDADGDDTQVYLIGEVYDKYLENHTVDAIIGYAISDPESSRVMLDSFVNNIDTYIGKYESYSRAMVVKADIERVGALRLAYKVVTREYLKDTMVDKENEAYVVNQAITKYVDSLSTEELLEVTEVVRYITGVIIYDNPAVLTFIGYMNYYSKLTPSSDVEEVATSAMIAMMMDILQPQLVDRKQG